MKPTLLPVKETVCQSTKSNRTNARSFSEKRTDAVFKSSAREVAAVPEKAATNQRNGAHVSSIRQAHREVAIRTPLGQDVLVFRSLAGDDQISRPFRYEVELLSEYHDIDFDEIIGQPVSVRLALGRDASRYYHGYVSRFTQLPSENRFARYQAEIVPWLWFLTRTSDCRIFQNKSVIEIIKEVFQSHGFSDYEFRTTHSYRPKKYCVQYRETDFNFVNRLLEHEGISYFFTHDDDKHTLVLADSPAGHGAFQGYEEIRILPPSEGFSGSQHIHQWTVEREVQPGAYAHTDYDFKKPRVNLQATYSAPRRHASSQFEIFEYPGDHQNFDVGEQYARIRVEELQARHELARGVADARGVCAGHCFVLSHSLRADQNREYLVCSVHHNIQLDPYGSSDSSCDQGIYQCTFTVMDAAKPFRPARVTPKPFVQGPQTAIVVGAKGKEVDVDKYGRVKVQFHWDRYGKRDENSSCWIRVSHPWAGKGFGGMSIPRIGQEVIVDFLEGDPDRPIINGRIYNGDTMPHASNAGRKTAGPPDLSQAAMMTSFKSNSFGGSGGHNEITMNDAGGAEGLFLKAQKDEIHLVGNDREDTIGNNRSTQVGVDSKETIGNNMNLEVGGNTIEKVGSAKVVDVGSTLLIKAGTSITLQCGASVIHMNQAGFITISGTVITAAAAVNASVSAPVTTISGAGLLALNSLGLTLLDGSVVRIHGFHHAHLGAPSSEVIASKDLVLKGAASIKING